jgi:hypothetical protein
MFRIPTTSRPAGIPARRGSWYEKKRTAPKFCAITAVDPFTDEEVLGSLVGIEEPETALHPAASAASADSLKTAAVTKTGRGDATTPSPEPLEQIDPETDRLLALETRDGRSALAPLDRASRQADRARSFTPGDFLRMNRLEVDRFDLQRRGGPAAQGDRRGPAAGDAERRGRRRGQAARVRTHLGRVRELWGGACIDDRPPARGLGSGGRPSESGRIGLSRAGRVRARAQARRSIAAAG